MASKNGSAAMADIQESLSKGFSLTTLALRGHAYKTLKQWHLGGADFDQVWRSSSLRQAHELCRWKGAPGWSARSGPDSPQLMRLLRNLNIALAKPGGRTFWLCLWRAELLALLERSPEAVRDLRRASTLRPRHPWSWMLLAEAKWEEDLTPEVLSALEHAQRLDPNLPARHLALLAESRFMTGDVRGAFLAFNRSVKASPAEERSLYHGWRGQARLWAGRYSLAIQDFDAALDFNPGFSWASAWKGGAYCVTGRPAEALPYIERGLALDPQDNEGHVWMGESLRLLGRLDEAEKFLRRPSREDTHTWSLVNLALSRCKRSDQPGAQRLLRIIRTQRGMRRFLDMTAEKIGRPRKQTVSSMTRLLQTALRANLGNRAHPPSPLHFERLKALTDVREISSR